MKHNYLKHLFTALLLLCTTMAIAHDFEVDGIYYEILSETDKTVEVTCKGALFSAYLNEYSGSVVIPTSVTKSEIVTNILETFDDWRSSNKSNSTTSQTSYTLNVEAGNILKFDWLVSSESNYDWLIITLDGTEIVKKSGTLSGCYEKTFDTAGSHTLVVKYTKDTSQSSGNDEGKIYNITLGSVGSVNDVVYRVTSIRNSAFKYCSGLTSITIPNSVTRIGEAAFHNCSRLANVVIGNSVTSIGNEAFCGCSGLTSITIPNSVTSIGSSAFSGCSGLTSIIVDDSNTKYDSRENCNAIIETETNKLMAGCQNTIIPNSVTSIEERAFYECSGLTSIEIPNSVTSIGEYTFSYCKGLTSIEIPNSVTSIGSSAFYGCSGLASIEIPNSVTRIGEAAFHNCTGLTSIEIPNSVTSFESYTFGYCTSLTSITIPNSVTSIGEEAFYRCTGLTSVVIGNSVTSIGECAFSSCTSLANIEIPNSVTSIRHSAFSYCTGLTSVEIPNSVTSIGYQAFCGCTGLTSVEIPNSVTSIGDDAFTGCTGLTSVVIPNSVTYIGWEAFSGCTGLTSVVIPNSVTYIGWEAFSGCTGLTSITSLIPADALFAVSSYTFYNVDKNTCTLYVPYGAKETYATTQGWKEFANIVELAPAELTITINQYGCATYCSPYALDFSNVDGLKAYAATGYKTNSQVITLTRVQTAEAGVGLFLKGEPGDYIVPVIESTDEHSLNMLVGTLKPTIVNSTDGSMSNYKFTILPGDETPMFYPFEDGTTLSAGKAYLQIPTAWLPAVAQKSLSVRFDDGETTDVDELKGEDGKVKGICYDLSGRVVENPTSGIYIIDGKKVLVK